MGPQSGTGTARAVCVLIHTKLKWSVRTNKRTHPKGLACSNGKLFYEILYNCASTINFSGVPLVFYVLLYAAMLFLFTDKIVRSYWII
jgi:hypothetical protein